MADIVEAVWIVQFPALICGEVNSDIPAHAQVCRSCSIQDHSGSMMVKRMKASAEGSLEAAVYE